MIIEALSGQRQTVQQLDRGLCRVACQCLATARIQDLQEPDPTYSAEYLSNFAVSPTGGDFWMS